MNEFGKFCRKLRIDHGELLKDMAEKLGCSPAYLSSVENGKKKVPAKWEDEIAALYSFDKQQREELESAIRLSQQSVELNINSFSRKDKEIAISFARKFDDLSEEQKNNIKKILGKL